VGLWTHVWDALWKTTFFYFLLILLMRITGKREIGTLSAIDLVGFIMISEAALISIADNTIPVLVGLAPVLALGVLELLVPYLSLKDQRLRRLVVGQPSILVAHGRINQRAMAELRFSVADLLAELRSKNVANIADVEFAILETSGNLSVIPKTGARPVTVGDLASLSLTTSERVAALTPAALPCTLVVDGVVDDAELHRAGRDRAWLLDALRAQGITDPGQVLLASVDGGGRVFVQRREDLGLTGERPHGDVAGAAAPRGGGSRA
jgi:uncharacterized membrane protein YcaP (DUF421 family)